MTQYPVIDHGPAPKSGSWLQNRRLKLALLLAVVEGLLVAVGVLEAWVAIVLAGLALVVYFGWAREQHRETLRDAFWVVAVWQAIVLLVPILVVIVGTLALVAVGAIAILALVALFADRR
jgi:thiol:disulfide interchange protein